MSRIDGGRRVTLTYRENDGTGKATLVIEISAGDDILPHEHREDIRNVAAEILNVPASALEGVDIEMKRKPGDHSHDHEHPHDHAHPVAEPEAPPKAKA